MPVRTSRSLLACLLAIGLPALAQEAPAPPESVEERLRRLEAELQALKASRPEPAPPPTGGASGAAKALNPDISLLGDFLGSLGHNEARPVPGLEMHEAELGLQSTIDPYSRGDVFLAFNEQGVNVEEAYLTFTALPGELVGKVGKMRAAFGKVNGTHNHALAWTDRPLMTENLMGGEDGINDMGLSLSRILPAPGNLFLEATAQVFRGTSEGLFQAQRKRDLSVVGHLRGYQDLTENTNLEVGYSFAQGHNELGPDFRTRLHGLDISLRWKPLQRAIYRSFLWRTECVWSHREQVPEAQRAFGLYSSLEFRLNQRWTLGGRFDYAQRATQASALDRGASLVVTYWMSEFSQVRSQYRFVRYDGQSDGNELRLQLTFVMGAHGAHPF